MTQLDNMCAIIPDNILWRKDDDKAVLFDEERGEPYLLNETATRIWELCHQGNKICRMLELLTEEFEGEPEIIRKETYAVLNSLIDKKLLRLATDDS
jgi:hypothetical protein